MRATLHVLDTAGYDAATVPAIAATAGLSPAALYRRFADKDELLRAALLRALHQSGSTEPARLRGQLLRPTLAATCERLVGLLLKQHRAHPLRGAALARMMATQPGSPFSRAAQRRVTDHVAALAAVLLEHRASIRHPHPERATRFAVLSTLSTLESVASEQVSLWHAALPLRGKALAAELARAMLAYLRRKP